MIVKINNFTYKSFVGYSNPNDLLFRAKNILFGYNGKGKSSVAIGIKNEFLKDQMIIPIKVSQHSGKVSHLLRYGKFATNVNKLFDISLSH